VSELEFAERPASGAPQGLLILHHGRGTDELDLLPLGDALDPDHRLQVVSVRAPLTLPGSPGYHWYVVPRVGYPDPATFRSAFDRLAALHDELGERYAIDPGRTLLGGFSMGAVMSYALGLAAGRPVPAGILAFSGFLPTVEGWEPDLQDRTELPVFIAHGRYDPTISVEFARAARAQLEAAGLPVSYHEFDGPHAIDPAHIPAARAWIGEALS
jgi:phospholipase/carboxylesterase